MAMSEEHREAIKAASKRRSNCQGCNSSSTRIVDGSEIGGFPGIKYKYCDGCGWSQAKTKRPPKFKL